MPGVSVDDPDTWPVEVRDAIGVRAQALAATAGYASDLAIDPDQEDEFRELLRGHSIVVYHATRLLDHEIDSIRHDGLLPLSAELVRARIEAAANSGYLTDAERGELLRGNLFADNGYVSNREGQVCFFLSRRALNEHVSGLWNLLTTWGGEGIYFGQFSEDVDTRLRVLGRPAVVVAEIELTEGWRTHSAFPGVLNSFVGRMLELDEYDSDLFYRSPVAGNQIADVWLPGDPDYDRHSELPRD